MDKELQCAFHLCKNQLDYMYKNNTVIVCLLQCDKIL